MSWSFIYEATTIDKTSIPSIPSLRPTNKLILRDRIEFYYSCLSRLWDGVFNIENVLIIYIIFFDFQVGSAGPAVK